MKSLLFLCSFLLVSATGLRASLAELLPEQLQNAEGEAVSRDALEGKLVGIYFSAEWCPPCRGFTPTLVQFRDRHHEAFEVVFVSSDRTPEAQRGYMKNYKMNFLTLEHRSAPAQALAQRFSVRGIPTLVIVDANGNVITTQGVRELSRNTDGALQAWQAKASE